MSAPKTHSERAESTRRLGGHTPFHLLNLAAKGWCAKSDVTEGTKNKQETKGLPSSIEKGAGTGTRGQLINSTPEPTSNKSSLPREHIRRSGPFGGPRPVEDKKTNKKNRVDGARNLALLLFPPFSFLLFIAAAWPQKCGIRRRSHMDAPLVSEDSALLEGSLRKASVKYSFSFAVL